MRENSRESTAGLDRRSRPDRAGSRTVAGEGRRAVPADRQELRARVRRRARWPSRPGRSSSIASSASPTRWSPPGFGSIVCTSATESRELTVVPLGDVGSDISPFPFVLSLPQDDHERLLTEQLRAAGQAVEWDTELTGFTQRDDGVRPRSASLAVRNHGTERTCAAATGRIAPSGTVWASGFRAGAYDQPFYVADAEAEGPWSDHDFTAYIAERTFCLAFPVRRRGMFRFIGVVPEALRDRDDLQFDDVRGEVEQVTGTRVTKVNWFSAYRVHHRVADSFRKGRVFLSGDAGHVHSPAGGQGMNTGIGDAVNLAWKLAAVLGGRANPVLLDSYEAERIPFARSLVRTTDRVFEAVVGRGVFSRLVRSVFAPFILPLALRFAAARRAQFRLVSQTRIAYRESPLSDGLGGRGPRRRPAALGRGGRQLRPAHFARLADPRLRHSPRRCSASSRRASTCPCTSGRGHRPPAMPGLERDALYLVRPDGHVGFARREPDVEALRAYLGRFGIVMPLD